jgi:hypothetical protein
MLCWRWTWCWRRTWLGLRPLLLGLRPRSFRTRCLLGWTLFLARCLRLRFALGLRALWLRLGLEMLRLLLNRPLGLRLRCRPLWLLHRPLRFDRSLRRNVVTRLYWLRWTCVVEPGTILPWLIDSRAIGLVGLIEPLSICSWLIDSRTIDFWPIGLVHARPVLPWLINSWANLSGAIAHWLVWLVDSRPIDARLVHAWPVTSRLIDHWPIFTRAANSRLVDSRPDRGLHTGWPGKSHLRRTPVVLVEELLPVL